MHPGVSREIARAPVPQGPADRHRGGPPEVLTCSHHQPIGGNTMQATGTQGMCTRACVHTERVEAGPGRALVRTPDGRVAGCARQAPAAQWPAADRGGVWRCRGCRLRGALPGQRDQPPPPTGWQVAGRGGKAPIRIFVRKWGGVLVGGSPRCRSRGGCGRPGQAAVVAQAGRPQPRRRRVVTGGALMSGHPGPGGPPGLRCRAAGMVGHRAPPRTTRAGPWPRVRQGRPPAWVSSSRQGIALPFSFSAAGTGFPPRRMALPAPVGWY